MLGNRKRKQLKVSSRASGYLWRARKQEKETIKELLTNEKVQFTLTEAADKKNCLVKKRKKTI